MPAADSKVLRPILLGMMGVGKTTIGQCLSDLTSWPYYDNDVLLARTQAASAAQILVATDEATLRAAESHALGEALRMPAPCIVGVAAGAVLDAQNRRAMREAGSVVWLRARLSTLCERIGGDAERPWLRPDPLTALERLYVGREELYDEVADFVVDVDDSDPETVAREIYRFLQNGSTT